MNELEEKTETLDEKNKNLEEIAKDLEAEKIKIEEVSKYKSEFLANMSHELRTPLNSILLLSANIAKNKESNLIEDQIESADIINQSGKIYYN